MVASGLLSEPGLFDRRGRIRVPRPVTAERARQVVQLLLNGGARVAAATQRDLAYRLSFRQGINKTQENVTLGQ